MTAAEKLETFNEELKRYNYYYKDGPFIMQGQVLAVDRVDALQQASVRINNIYDKLPADHEIELKKVV